MAEILDITTIKIDFSILASLAAECDKAQIQRPLIVTDVDVKAAGIFQQALDALPGMAVAVTVAVAVAVFITKRRPTPPRPTALPWTAWRAAGRASIASPPTGRTAKRA
jgi:hypothetical protein